MKKSKRPGLFSMTDRGLAIRQKREMIAKLMLEGMTRDEALAEIKRLTKMARSKPMENEKCGILCKQTKLPCVGKALPAGPCRIHGGLAGPRTPEGRIKAIANLRPRTSSRDSMQSP